MKYNNFKHINELNRKDGVYPWNYLEITGIDEVQGTINFKKVNGQKDVKKEIFTMNGNIFVEQLIKYHILCVVNPEALKDSSFVNYYIVDRTLFLQRLEEENHVFVEKYAGDNTERTFKYTLVIDYREPTNTKHKYTFDLGDFMEFFFKHDNDVEKTFNYILKKIRKKIKSVPELYCLTQKEQAWLEKAVEKELNYLIYDVMK